MKKRKNNLLLCIDSLNSGGAQKQMVLLANELVKYYNVILIYYNNYNFFKEELKAEIKVIHVNGKLNFILSLIKLIHNSKIDIVYSYLNTTNILVGLIGIILGYKHIIISERGGHFLESKIRMLLIRIIARRIKYIVVNSKHLKECIKTQINIRNVVYIPNIINISDDCIENKSHKNINIGIIGRFEKEKNQIFPLKMFIDSFCITNKVVFHFAGRKDTPYFKNTIFPFVKKNNIEQYCRFYGTIKDTKNFIRKMDFIILPSLKESFSNVLIESYNMCRVVLCSNVGDNKIIIDNKSYGFIYNNNDEFRQYFTQLCKMSGQERAKMAKKGKRKIKARYNLVGINKNIRILNSILEKRSEK